MDPVLEAQREAAAVRRAYLHEKGRAEAAKAALLQVLDALLSGTEDADRLNAAMSAAEAALRWHPHHEPVRMDVESVVDEMRTKIRLINALEAFREMM